MMARLGLCDGYVTEEGGKGDRQMKQLTVITYKRVKKLEKSYETETLEISTIVPDNMNINTAIALLKEKVLSNLNIGEKLKKDALVEETD
jgi:hypothetical protein